MTPRPLRHLNELDAALAAASVRPILIFKHSETCGISAQAYEEVVSLLADPEWPVDIYLVSVWAGRAVSNAIAARLHVRHASPQILLMEKGVVRWNASHFRVTADAIRSALWAPDGKASRPMCETDHKRATLP